MRRTKIVCTLGPSTDDALVMQDMIKVGMNVARLNMSHGSFNEHSARMELVRKTQRELNLVVGIMLDTKGPEIRLRTFKEGKVLLSDGQMFVLTTEQSVEGTENIVAVNYLDLPKKVKVGDTILINDGKIDLAVKSIEGREVHCVVRFGGEVSDKKAINLPDVDLDMPFISKVDKEDIEYGIKQKVDYIALSFVRTAQDVLDVRELLKKNKATHIQLVSKIENRQGVNNLAEIIKVSDGIMVARGDMGVEIPYAELPWIQKNMIKACNDAGKFVITATQMLESMINNPRPTRAEVSDVANAVFDGTSATMLSGESAAGKFPVSAVSAMANIIVNVEKGIDYKSKFSKQPLCSDGASAAAGQGACNMAMAAEVQAIVIPTQSGNTVRQVARFKPQQPIIAICMDKQVATQLSCYWGVTAIYGERCTNSDELVKYSLNKAANTGLIKKGDSVVLTMGSQVGKFCVINNTVMQYN